MYMKIIIGSDHAGFELKKTLIGFLKNAQYDVEDVGAFSFVADDDYPDYINKVAEKIAVASDDTKGIIIGGSGQGEAISANRFRGARAALYYGGDMKIVELSREHNDANILSLGARFISAEEAENTVSLWLATPFSNEEKHLRRIRKIDSKPEI